MTKSISSAQPWMLYRYADTGAYINREMISESNHLAHVLQHFEATCTEYRVHVSYLAHDLRAYAQWADPIDRWVRKVGKDFEKADRRALLDRILHWIEKWRKGKKLWETWQPIFAGTIISSSIRAGSAYEGEIIINLPDFLRKFGFSLREIRKWAGLSPYLNHIKYTNLPSHFAKVGLITSIPIIVYKWFQDVKEWREERYSKSRLASAMTVDAGLTLGTTVAATWAGAKVGALIGAGIGSLIPGVGTAVGGAVGAVIGGVVGGVAATWAINKYDIREKSISWLDEHLFSPVAKAIAKGVDTVHNWVDAAAKRLHEKFEDVRSAFVVSPAYAQGQVLGVNTDAKDSLDFVLADDSVGIVPQEVLMIVQRKPWSQLPSFKKELNAQIQAIQRDMEKVKSKMLEIQKSIDEIDKEKAQLERRRKDLINSMKFYDSLLPSRNGLEMGFDDPFPDAPYRTRKDDIEDEIAQINHQINQLEVEKESKERQMGSLATEYNEKKKLSEFKQAQIEQINQRLRDGIRADGPTKRWILNKLGGCTNYVAQKRNLDDWKRWPDAHAWDDRAREAGYGVGKVPVKHAIIVFEKGAEYHIDQGRYSYTAHASRTYGHVAFVEEVDWKYYPDKVRIKISEGNYDGRMGYPGKIRTGIWVEITKEELKNISFIYEKKTGVVSS